MQPVLFSHMFDYQERRQNPQYPLPFLTQLPGSAALPGSVISFFEQRPAEAGLNYLY